MGLLAFLKVLDLDHVMRWIGSGGYYVLFALLFACGLGLPLPEDIPLIVSGIFIARGHMHVGIVGIVAWCGIIGGDCVLYSLGKKYGLNITRVPFIGKHVTRKRIEWAEKKFEKYGILVVGVGRLFAGIRGAMVVAAGAIRFNFIKFIIADGLAAIISGGAFIALGYWFGANLDLLEKKVKGFENVLKITGILLAIGLAIYIVWRSRSHKTVAEVVVEKVEEHAAKKEQVEPGMER
ncbi:MAG TPA: DedA family protein [Tepidisphaeraceae bacterium]|jgi:membrane protein DedA with SNARE-associated domain